jgi:hypothetical protein
MPKKVTAEDIDLLAQLGLDTTSKKKADRTPCEQRIIAGYEEVAAFVVKHGRMPEHGEDRDVFERLYAVRLDQLRNSTECRVVLAEVDTKRLLDVEPDDESTRQLNEDGPSDEELLEALGVFSEDADDITALKHVRSQKEIQAAETVAQRVACEDFSIFKPLFVQVQHELENGIRKTIKFQDNAGVKQNDFFILDGQKLYIAAVGEQFINKYDRPDRRLRVIYDNGTEIEMLLRSLQRALNKDEASRRITDTALGPLFADDEDAEDTNVGYIYVLRSESTNEFIAENRSVIHKIGVTGGSVKKRISNAEKDPTYLLAKVKVVETYKLANMNPSKLEKLLHKFFSRARLDVELQDRFGQAVQPREWFLVPLPVIEEAINKLMDGSLSRYEYEHRSASIIEVSDLK